MSLIFSNKSLAENKKNIIYFNCEKFSQGKKKNLQQHIGSFAQWLFPQFFFESIPIYPKGRPYSCDVVEFLKKSVSDF